jgi:hypothetical protein
MTTFIPLMSGSATRQGSFSAWKLTLVVWLAGCLRSIFAGSSVVQSTGIHRMVCLGGRWFESTPVSWWPCKQVRTNGDRCQEPLVATINYAPGVGDGSGGSNAEVAQLARALGVSAPGGWRFKSSPRHYGGACPKGRRLRQGQVAQMLERRVERPGVRWFNSSPAHQWCRITTSRERSSVGRASSVMPSKARRFKSCRSLTALALGRALRRNAPQLAGSIPVRCANPHNTRCALRAIQARFAQHQPPLENPNEDVCHRSS